MTVLPTGYWLLKSEPETFGIDDLRLRRREAWDGVRNYQARNLIRDGMAPGQGVLFYHSSTKPPGVAGIARIVSLPYPDPTQFDPRSSYYDAAASLDDPRWYCADVEYVETLPQFVPLDELKQEPALSDMLVVRRGQRLSVQPVSRAQFSHVLRLGRARSKL